MQGIHGRLGDLGAIDAEFDAAVSNAAVGLDHIVVDTTEDAKHCLEFLRKHNLGVCTFLVLALQEKLEDDLRKRVEVPNGCHRLFDLIKCRDAKLKPAFFWSVRNTLVCPNLEKAKQVAYNSPGGNIRRTVTLTVRSVRTCARHSTHLCCT